STVAADLAPAATASRSAGNCFSPADPECVPHPADRSSACVPGRLGSWPRPRSTPHGPDRSADPQTSGCCPLTPAPHAPLQPALHRTAWLLLSHASACV